MKLLNMMLIFAAIMFSITIFDFHPITGPGTLISGNDNYTNWSANYNYSSYAEVNGTIYSSNDIWDVWSSPASGGGLSVVAMLIIFASWLAIIGLFNIFGFGYRSDLSMMGPIFIFLLGIGFIPVAILYNFITRETGMYACSAHTLNCWPAEIAGAIIAGTLFVMWIAACIEWWTQRSMS
jgi:hypothetical protein